MPPRVDLRPWFRVLANSDAQVGSVVLPVGLPRADLRLQMPFRVGAWPEEYEALELDKLSKTWPANSMMTFSPLSRDSGRCDILISQGTARDLLKRTLTSAFKPRAAFVMLLSPSDAQWQQADDLVIPLLGELQAAGLSFLDIPSQSDFAQRFAEWTRELSHDRPLDLALHAAFGETAFNMLDLRLIEAMALSSPARILGRRLRMLPSASNFQLAAFTAGRIRFNWTPAASPAALGIELGNKATVLPAGQESEGATALSEISVAEQAARRSPAAPEPVRVLQADIFALRPGEAVRQTQPFVVNKPYRIETFIGDPGTGALEADLQFPDKELDWQNADQFTLGVVFSEPNQLERPILGEMILGRYGASTRCRIDFVPTKPDPFRARITILYRGRVLQTALLDARVVASAGEAEDALDKDRPRLSIETRLRHSLSTLDDRRRFDASLVLNRTADDKATMQVAGAEGAYITSLEEVGQQLQRISGLLTDVANDAKTYRKGLASKASVAMLVQLASEGRELYRKVVLSEFAISAAARALETSEYLQIVATKVDAVVPLELIYQYGMPAKDAKLCPNSKQALKDGGCPAQCVAQARKSPAPHVCPMGFWGLSKVIERQLHHKIIPGARAVVSDEPVKGRSAMSLKGNAFMATSARVPPKNQKALRTSIEKHWTTGTVSVAKKWADWTDLIVKQKPVLVVALPHSDGDENDISLEINNDTLETRFIDQTYLTAGPPQPAPLLLLMGCDVVGAGNAQADRRHIAQFRSYGARVILGTLAMVDGADAAAAAELIVERFAAAVKAKPTRLGEVLRDIKRAAMADGLLMTLGLMGFGDADWELEF